MLGSRGKDEIKLMNLSKSPESYEESLEGSMEHRGERSRTIMDDNDSKMLETRFERLMKNKTNENLEEPELENVLSLVDKDKTLFNLKCLLDDKRNYILEKRRELSNKKKENEYLSDVSNEYKKEYITILKDKENQLNALNELSRHFKNLAKEYNKNRNILKKIRKDQREILNEIKKIKNEIRIVKEYGSSGDEEENISERESESPFEEEMESFIENESEKE